MNKNEKIEAGDLVKITKLDTDWSDWVGGMECLINTERKVISTLNYTKDGEGETDIKVKCPGESYSVPVSWVKLIKKGNRNPKLEEFFMNSNILRGDDHSLTLKFEGTPRFYFGVKNKDSLKEVAKKVMKFAMEINREADK